MLTRDEIDARFDGHELNEEQRLRIECIRHVAKDLAMCINDLCPDGRNKSVAFLRLEDVVMRANKAIAESGNLRQF
ncbi:MAG: hypothetical protein IKF14_13465 [Atopobiaceae bacterium]|nr:hypothetical protein [Atopobiaceae bacterium]